MINLPFTLHPLEEYDKFITNYKGLDLSFLSLDSSKYINQWATPVTRRKVDDREVTIIYTVPNLHTANNILYGIYNSSDLHLKTKGPRIATSQARLISGSCDAFAQNMTVTVRLLVEPGFLFENTHPHIRDFTFSKDNILLSGALDWSVYINPAAAISTPLQVVWGVAGYSAGFSIYCPVNNGASLKFNTRDINKSTYGSVSLAQAVSKGEVILKGEPVPDLDSLKSGESLGFKIIYNGEASTEFTFWERFLLV